MAVLKRVDQGDQSHAGVCQPAVGLRVEKNLLLCEDGREESENCSDTELIEQESNSLACHWDFWMCW